MHHLSICPRREFHISMAVIRCQVLVRFFALLRIKPHAPLLVRVPVNSFEFQPCGRTPQAGYLSTSSIHRLRCGLPGYLILFAPHTFVSQRQLQASYPPSPPVFFLISTHSTATLGIPIASPALKSASLKSSTRVKPGYFTPNLTNRLHTLYAQSFRTTLAPYVLPRLLARS